MGVGPMCSKFEIDEPEKGFSCTYRVRFVRAGYNSSKHYQKLLDKISGQETPNFDTKCNKEIKNRLW